MHVAHVTLSATNAGGGVAVAVSDLSDCLGSLGVRQSVLALVDEGEPLDRGWRCPDVRCFSWTQRAGLKLSAELAEALASLDWDIAHTHALWSHASLSVRRVGGASRRPWVVSPHGMMDDWALRHSYWKKRVARWLYENRHLKGAGCLHALCQAEADSLRGNGFENPIALIPNGVNLPSLAPGAPAVDKADKILLFLGRLHPKKGLVEAVQGWNRVRHQHPAAASWKWVIAGWDQGEHEKELQRLADSLEIPWVQVGSHGEEEDMRFRDVMSGESAASLFFVGPVFGEEKDELLRLADAFILPSHSEGLPMGVLEAWAYRTPVVMTVHCHLDAGFEEGAAIQVDPEPESIAKGLRGLFAMNEEDLRSMGDRGRALVEKVHSWPVVAKEMKAVYDWVLGGGEKPSTVESHAS